MEVTYDEVGLCSATLESPCTLDPCSGRALCTCSALLSVFSINKRVLQQQGAAQRAASNRGKGGGCGMVKDVVLHMCLLAITA